MGPPYVLPTDTSVVVDVMIYIIVISLLTSLRPIDRLLFLCR